jgi:uncharacterized protein (TIGR01777 family)
MDERDTEFNNDFSTDVVNAWEGSVNDIKLPSTRKVILRISIVLAKDEGAMPRLLNLVRFGLGGKQGSGSQFFSWIHEEDLCRIIDWCIAHPEEEGIYNCCSPNPVTNDYLMRCIRKHSNMSFGLPATNWMLKIGALLIGTETELILKSRRVVPTNLLSKGFTFKYPDLNTALSEIIK